MTISRSIPLLGFASAALFIAYLALVAITMVFASIRTDLMALVDERESEVAALETEYYDAISRLSGVDVFAEGFVTPSAVEYVAKNGTPTLTRADR